MEIVAIAFTVLLLALGSAWVFLPFVSGPLLAWCGLLACHLIWPHGPVGVATLVFCGVLVAVAKVVDWLASLWTTRRFGGSWAGAIGAPVGGLVFVGIGLLTGVGVVAGALFGPVIGAVAGELMAGREAREALRAGTGAFLGFFVAMLFSLLVCGLMAAIFATELLVHAVS